MGGNSFENKILTHPIRTIPKTSWTPNVSIKGGGLKAAGLIIKWQDPEFLNTKTSFCAPQWGVSIKWGDRHFPPPLPPRRPRSPRTTGPPPHPPTVCPSHVTPSPPGHPSRTVAHTAFTPPTAFHHRRKMYREILPPDHPFGPFALTRPLFF